jgi:hypothetical protein
MRRFRFWARLTLGFGLAMMSGGCLLIPQIKDRTVELAVAGATVATLRVQSTATSVDTTAGIQVSDQLGLQDILNKAGIDKGRVTNIRLSGVAYVVRKVPPDQPITGGAITGGTITIKRGTGSPVNLVTDFSADLGAESGFRTIPLQQPGVDLVNDLLADILAALPAAPADPTVQVHLTGSTSSPPKFDLMLKITVSISGKVDVSVPT